MQNWSLMLSGQTKTHLRKEISPCPLVPLLCASSFKVSSVLSLENQNNKFMLDIGILKCFSSPIFSVLSCHSCLSLSFPFSLFRFKVQVLCSVKQSACPRDALHYQPVGSVMQLKPKYTPHRCWGLPALDNWFLYQQELMHTVSYPFIAAGEQKKNRHRKQKTKVPRSSISAKKEKVDWRD